jgi:hypothetical protein
MLPVIPNVKSEIHATTKSELAVAAARIGFSVDYAVFLALGEPNERAQAASSAVFLGALGLGFVEADADFDPLAETVGFLEQGGIDA